MEACLEARQTNGMVQERGHSDTDRLHLRQHVAVIPEPAAIELLSGELAAVGIRVSNTHELCILEQAQHAGMVPTHIADADHTHLHRHHRFGHRQACGIGLIISDRPPRQQPLGDRRLRIVILIARQRSFRTHQQHPADARAIHRHNFELKAVLSQRLPL